MLYHLGVALAIGLVVGIERGWTERDAGEGERIAGLRTFGLIGLLGGAAGLLADSYGALVVGAVFVGLAILLSTAYFASRDDDDDNGVTSLVASLLTFVLGVLATRGQLEVAVASAVVATLLLSQKPRLHGWVRALEPRELQAGIRLLLISAVALPLLPDRGYGPWQALNPYAIWWMVVLIATISFAGYFAIKLAGAARGVLFTGLFGGLASSTAVTLDFSRLARREPALAPVLASGILLACGTMLPRVLVVATVLNVELFARLWLPVAAMACVIYLPALYGLRRRGEDRTPLSSPMGNPLGLRTALFFGVVLGLVLLLGKALQAVFGDAGVLALAVVSGITDVDPITLSLARMSQEDLALGVAATGILLATSTNTLTKGVMAAMMGGRAMMLRVALPLFSSAGIGTALGLWLQGSATLPG